MITSKTGQQYTEGELSLAVRQERAALTEEARRKVRRLEEIEARLKELDKAEALLEGGM